MSDNTQRALNLANEALEKQRDEISKLKEQIAELDRRSRNYFDRMNQANSELEKVKIKNEDLEQKLEKYENLMAGTLKADGEALTQDKQEEGE